MVLIVCRRKRSNKFCHENLDRVSAREIVRADRIDVGDVHRGYASCNGERIDHLFPVETHISIDVSSIGLDNADER